MGRNLLLEEATELSQPCTWENPWDLNPSWCQPHHPPPCAKSAPGTLPLNITVAQLSFSFFRTKTMFPGRTCSSSVVSGMNSYRTRCGCPSRALGLEAMSGGEVVLPFYFIGDLNSASLFLWSFLFPPC